MRRERETLGKWWMKVYSLLDDVVLYHWMHGKLLYLTQYSAPRLKNNKWKIRDYYEQGYIFTKENWEEQHFSLTLQRWLKYKVNSVLLAFLGSGFIKHCLLLCSFMGHIIEILDSICFSHFNLILLT